MRIESNIIYISKIIKIFELVEELYNDGKTLLNNIKELIIDEKNKIKYLFNEKRNPEHAKEVNELFYILLASICYIITSILTETCSDKNELQINLYFWILKEINYFL